MRIALLFCLFLATITVSSQNVNIPDPVLKALLVNTNNSQNQVLKAWGSSSPEPVAIDTNNDDEIQLSEALAIKKISLYSSSDIINVTSIQGLEAFANLVQLSIGNTNLSSLNLTPFVNLTYAELYSNSLLQSVNVSGLPLLNWLIVTYNPALTSVLLQGTPALTELDLFDNNISAVDLSSTPNLFYLDCRDNNLQLLNISSNTYLDEVYCGNNPLTSLICSGLPNLRYLVAPNTNLTTINTTGLSNMTWFDVSESNISSLDLSTNIKLDNISVNNTLLTTIDISSTPIVVLYAKNSLITYANLKNGKVFQLLELENNPLAMACISDNLGPNHYQVMQTKFTQMGYPNIVLSSFCSFEPAGSFNKITGNIKFDSNSNGCGAEDGGVANAQVKIVNGQLISYFISDNNGAYTAFTGTGASTVGYLAENSLFTATPNLHTLNFSGGGQNESAHFCVTAPASVQDLEVVIVPLTTAQPGFDAGYKVIYKNKGSIGSLAGSVTLAYDDARIDLVNIQPAATSDNGGVITWNFTGLQPFETRSMYVLFNINAPGETPPVELGNVLTYTATIATAVTDVTPQDNQSVFNHFVTGSFDPNDITCLEGSTANPSLIGDYLHYNINFENVGTAPATFVVVEDNFNTAQYRPESFVFLEASHPVKIKIEGNKATFRFDNINLGPEEKGNIVFKIKTVPGLITGASVSNKANIFFDYNLPIETNTANTTFQALSTGSWTKDDSVKMYPNPSAGMVMIEASTAINSIELYDVQGRLLEIQKAHEISASFDITARAKGIYFVKVKTDSGVKVEKIIRE